MDSCGDAPHASGQLGRDVGATGAEEEHGAGTEFDVALTLQ